MNSAGVTRACWEKATGTIGGGAEIIGRGIGYNESLVIYGFTFLCLVAVRFYIDMKELAMKCR